MERRILTGASPRHKVARTRRGRSAECRAEQKGAYSPQPLLSESDRTVLTIRESALRL
ncbi:hypothetical protein HSEST_2599 [Halapricum desulfuricans]|uniref:Uncharacterized protein n=1 Tax=Halapricum desulfuricans TaxID=2841257 RepID=A0A897NZW5_9EURY|nr:hypothetical protein HSEST_2599 [Halapricum desulfuricans]